MNTLEQFEEDLSRAREALEQGDTTVASECVERILSVRKQLDEEHVARATQLQARILIGEEEYEEAEEVLQNSLELLPHAAEGHVLLAELMLLEDRLDEAAAALQSALEVSPEDTHALSLLVFCHARSGNNASAQGCFDRCLQLDSERSDVYHHMGVCCLFRGGSDAKSLFEKAIAKNSVLSGPHYYLGTMETAAGDFAAAEEHLRKELELNPANSLAEFQLIRLYLLRAPWPEAVALFDAHFPPELFCDIPILASCRFHFNYDVLNTRFDSFVDAVLQQLPQTPENLFHIAKIYRLKSLFGDAVEVLKKIFEADRFFRPVYTELADLYRVQDELSRACEILEEPVKLFGDAESLCALARMLFQCGRYTEAEQAIRKAVSLGPDLAEPHYLLGAVLAEFASRRSGSEALLEEAEKSLKKALGIDPHHKPSRTYLMHVTLQQEKHPECLELARRVLADDPQDRAALSYAGRCYRATGELALAEDHLVRLVEHYPDDPSGRALLAEVYETQRKFDEAAEQLEQAVTVPGRRPQPDLLFRIAEIYLLHLNEPAKAREHLLRFLQTAPPGHPDFDRAKEILGGTPE